MFNSLLATGALSIGLDVAVMVGAPLPSIGSPIRAMTGHANNGRSNFDPRINRHTGRPHEHRREIARNLRKSQAA